MILIYLRNYLDKISIVGLEVGIFYTFYLDSFSLLLKIKKELIKNFKISIKYEFLWFHSLPVCQVNLLSYPQPVLQHLFMANSSDVQIRLPILAHLAWALANVVVIQGFGVTHVLPFLLQHLTAPLANIFDLDDISLDLGLLPCLGHPSARPSFYLVLKHF